MTEWGQQPSEMTNRRLLLWIALGLTLMISPVLQLWEIGTVSWISLGAGFFISIAIFSEHTSDTRPGQKIENWWRRIGIAGRILVIIAFTAVIWGSIWFFNPPLVPLESSVIGLFLGFVVKYSFFLIKRIVISDRQISWASR